MQIVKYISLFIIFCMSTILGIIISKKYDYRVNELRELKNILNIIKTKIKFTYEPIAQILEEIYISSKTNIGEVFKRIHINMENQTIEDAWENGLQASKTNLTKEDIGIIKELGKTLGKTDIEGQTSQIDIVSSFLDVQIKKAEDEKQKNQKLYKTLGAITGLVFVIILI